MMIRRLPTALVATPLLACSQPGDDMPPEKVVETFVDHMQRVHIGGGAARKAYDLMWSQDRKNLIERAKRASALSGRKVAPGEMITPQRFTLSFKPRTYRATRHQNWAMVKIYAEGKSKKVAQVRTVLEDDRWRVVLSLPPPPHIERRLEHGAENDDD